MLLFSYLHFNDYVTFHPMEVSQCSNHAPVNKHSIFCLPQIFCLLFWESDLKIINKYHYVYNSFGINVPKELYT